MTQHPIAAFLLARYDELERKARAATPGPWRHNPDKQWRKPNTTWSEEAVFAGPPGDDATCIAGTGDADDPQSMADAAHIAAHDPAYVLADIAAKRRIVATFVEIDTHPNRLVYAFMQQQWVALRAVVAGLALPFAQHPDYQETWRP